MKHDWDMYWDATTLQTLSLFPGESNFMPGLHPASTWLGPNMP